MRRWRILLTNDRLDRRAGTDTVLRDFALGLHDAGHTPMVYAPVFGELGSEIRSAGIPVVADLHRVPQPPDLVQANQHVEAVQALLHFPQALGVFICHHRAAYMAAPPLMRRIRRYVAVDRNCLERLTDDYAIPPHMTRVIYNAVDTSRFLPRPPLPATPQRAAVFSNYAAPGTFLDTVQEACASANLPLDVIGSGVGKDCTSPEGVLGHYDLVFAKARCALEAMAVGAAVVLCGCEGLGPMVSAANVATLQPWNFGMRVLRDSVESASVVRRIGQYDARDASAVSDYIRTRASLPGSLEQYVQLYGEIMTEASIERRSPAEELDEYVRATATRIFDLEAALAEFRRPYRMEPLSEAAAERLAVRITASPQRVDAGRPFDVEVEVENHTADLVGSFPPYPLNLSYRWTTADTGKMVVAEGRRTPLLPAVAPGQRATHRMRIEPPEPPGAYTLRLTLVQESVRWLDELAGRRALAEQSIAVNPRSLTAR